MRRGAPLAGLTTLGVGGTARALLSPRGENELVFILKWLYSEGLEPYVIGGGSNTLAADGEIDIPVVLTRGMDGVNITDKDGDMLMTCGAGVELREIFALCASEGWSGMEFAAGIPGTIGGALMGNAGTPGGDIASVVDSVRVINSAGSTLDLRKDDIEWGYRKSSLSDGSLYVSSVVLRFRLSTIEAVKAGAKLALDARKSQPLGARTAGCVFKNPANDTAGRLLEASGCKGLSQGGARVSPLHANFIENYANSTATDIAKLASACRRKVSESFGVTLDYEIRSFGFPDGFLKD